MGNVERNVPNGKKQVYLVFLTGAISAKFTSDVSGLSGIAFHSSETRDEV